MSELFPEKKTWLRRNKPAEAWTDERAAVLQQYVRAREYCGFSLDQVINSRSAQNYLREIWMLGCMVRKPAKCNQLPPGNPFRDHSSQDMDSSPRKLTRS